MIKLFDGSNKPWNVPNLTEVGRDRKVIQVSTLGVIPEERIGSKSTRAEVFKWKYGDTLVAVKVIRITGISSKSECNIAKAVSDLVVQGKSPYFPILYGTGTAQTVVFNDGKVRQNACVLFSEMAYTDLANCAMTLTVSQLNEVILQVLKGIRDLQLYCNVVHNDLHLGNVLLLRNPDKYGVQALIHDFDRSATNPRLGTLAPLQKKKDAIVFLHCIRDLRRDKAHLHQKIDTAIDILNDSTSQFPILDVIRFWE
jgi:hypothetical protein